MFDTADVSKSGMLTGRDTVIFLRTSGLSDDVLRQVRLVASPCGGVTSDMCARDRSTRLRILPAPQRLVARSSTMRAD